MFKLCLPSILYLIFNILFTIWYIWYFKEYSLTNFIIYFITLIFYTWLLNYLCNINYKSISWILFFIFIVFSITSIFLTKKLNITSSNLYED
jgi:hypothetical protein